MWLPERWLKAPDLIAYGYSVSRVDGHRFPSTGYVEYPYGGYTTSYEVINTVTADTADQDVTTLDFNKKVGFWDGFNPVQHYKRSCTVSSALVSNSYVADFDNFQIPLQVAWSGSNVNAVPSGSDTFGGVDNPIKGLPLLWTNHEDGVFRALPSGMIDNALASMLPTIRPGTSLLNSIYELKDVKTLPKTVHAVTGALDKLEYLLKNELGILKKSWGRKSLRAILNGPADVHLQYKFNIASLLQDILRTSNSVNIVSSKVAKLKVDAGKPLRRHFKAPLGLRDQFDEYSVGFAGCLQPTSGSVTRQTRYHTQTFTATLEYSFTIPDVSDEELLYLGLQDYLGLTPSLQTLWNAVPWTFVVDWVVGVGPWLGQFTGRQLEVVTHISKFGWSVKVEREISTALNPFGQVARLVEKSYFRTPDHVPLVDSLRVSGLNPNEFSLATSLVVTHK